MSYCINPLCSRRHNPEDSENCLACGNPLLIDGRIRLLRPLRSLDEDPSTYTDVFEVEDVEPSWGTKSRIRVLKVLRWSDPKLVRLVQRESLVLQTLYHPGVPKCGVDDYFTFILKDGRLVLHCLVMEKIEGENLQQWLISYGRIPQKLALDWLAQLVDILESVHRSGFFHRDIKPENIIYQPDGQLALVDFGAARQITTTYLAKVGASGVNKRTRFSSGYEVTVVRTIRFSPLEQLNGQALPQSDFYALGRTFVNLLTGISLLELPIDQNTGRLIWRDKAPHIDKPLADLLDDMMAPFPGQRPQTTQVILERLQRLPFKLKLNRFLVSNIFKCFLVSSLIVSINSSYNQINLAVSAYYFNQAGHYMNEPKIAKKYYELALIYNPKDDEIYNNLAVACQVTQDLNCAIENYQKAFKLKPNAWELHYNLGNFYDEQGQYDQAEQQYKLSIKYGKNQPMNAVNNLSRLKNIQKKYSEAAQLALEGLKRTSDPVWQAALYKNLGWARFKQQRYAEAKDYLQKSVDLDSRRVDAHCLLAKTQEALNDLDNARTHWEVCLISNNSGLPEISDWKQQILQRIFPTN
ncbi:protein kinase domain-containing protein [Nostoc sp. LEGE 12450]|uniref:protein kinase domain-containing protein n=1 Tax=Nostoc sp. LEGE 12450 TaxID=1828643 RepID=UPI0018801A28|nr:serine/threonine-protein kinase [Nostoc sp. LEGE 12450]MBE8991344.1 tetratricopeptide repeat protein [Nostoc sp. LEGE 12450]